MDAEHPMSAPAAGFAEEEIDYRLSTREAAYKWVVVVDQELPAGRAANAAACTAASAAVRISGLLGAESTDADGASHAALPWAGCTVLEAGREKLRALFAKASAREDVLVADMPAAAQQTRVYAEYLEEVSRTAGGEIVYAGISLFGPRKRIERLVGGLSLLG